MTKGELIGRGRTAEVYAWGKNQVLKLYLEQYPADIAQREAAAQQAVHDAGLPAPDVGEVIHIENRHGVIMERIFGPTLSDVMKIHPRKYRDYARLMAELHSNIHKVSIPGLEPLRLRLWSDIALARAIPLHVKQELAKVLVGLPDGNSVCHYDFHPMNIIMSPRGPIIIDWEPSGKGNPVLDIARTWLLLTKTYLPVPFPRMWVYDIYLFLFFKEYLNHYSRMQPVDFEKLKECHRIIIAARLNEAIPAEDKKLLKLLKLPPAGYEE